jgi:hypothetical protein
MRCDAASVGHNPDDQIAQDMRGSERYSAFRGRITYCTVTKLFYSFKNEA